MDGLPAANGPHPPPRGRRMRPRALVGLLLLALLLGRGLSILGGGDEAAGEPESPRDAGPAAVTAPGAADPGNEPAHDLEAGRVVHAALPPRPAAEVRPAASTGLDPDRFDSLFSVVQARAEEGQWGRARVLLEQLRALPLDAGQRAALAPAGVAVAEAMAAAVAALRARLVRGEVLASLAVAVALPAEPSGGLADLLRGAQVPLAPGRDPRAVPGRQDEPWPQPKALALDRLLRVRLGADVQVGRVAGSRSDEVTIRVQDARGVTYPTVPVVHCEPAEVDGAEAVEMGLAALHAGDGLLARLWLGCALARAGTGPPSPRCRWLEEQLR